MNYSPERQTPSPSTAYFLPDSMNLSYSTAILQDRAWRLWAAEQLVLMTFPEGRTGVKTPVLGHHAPPRRGCFTPGMMGGRNPTGFMLGGACAMLFWAKSKLWLLGAREMKWGCIPGLPILHVMPPDITPPVPLAPWEQGGWMEGAGGNGAGFSTRDATAKALALFPLPFPTAATCYLLAQLEGNRFPA